MDEAFSDKGCIDLSVLAHRVRRARGVGAVAAFSARPHSSALPLLPTRAYG